MDLISGGTLDEVVNRLTDDVVSKIVPEIQAALENALNGLSVTITVNVMKK